VLASEVYGMVAGVDITYARALMLRQITAHLSLPAISPTVCTDSHPLYECLVKPGIRRRSD
jgi:hypothetical protein